MTRAGDPVAWGVQTRYLDATRSLRDAPPHTVDAVLESMGAHGDAPPRQGTPLFVREGAGAPLDAPCELLPEGGASAGVVHQVPADLGIGYHRLRDAATDRLLVVAPARCHAPPAVRTWGFAAQLYALRSQRSWGMGDLGDLAALARWSATRLGAGVLQVNPLHAAVPVAPQQPSPYFPSSRRFRSPLYLRVEEVDGAAVLGALLEPLARAGRALNRSPSIDRDAVWRLKADALAQVYSAGIDAVGLDTYRDRQGPGLTDFATHCAIAEVHGPDWRTWPGPLRRPDTAEVTAARRAHADRVRFHEWLQWQVDRQLGVASQPLALIHDLAVGVDGGGADAWLHQDVLATGMRVGAPPDEFNTAGQDWGLPPFDPWRLRAAGYAPFVEMVRAAFRHAGALRIDHVMGLFRLYWIPDAASPGDGVYVRYPVDDLLDIVCLESVRAGAFVCGEDLGTVEAGVRETLAARDILGYRLLWFEDEPPRRWSPHAMAAVTTHDLPTVAGLWSGRDLDDQRAAGMTPNEASTRRIVDRISALTGAGARTPVDDVVVRVHEVLARAPSVVLTATLEDVALAERRPNLPGTHLASNWSRPLPLTLEELQTCDTAARVAGALRRDDAPR